MPLIWSSRPLIPFCNHLSRSFFTFVSSRRAAIKFNEIERSSFSDFGNSLLLKFPFATFLEYEIISWSPTCISKNAFDISPISFFESMLTDEFRLPRAISLKFSASLFIGFEIEVEIFAAKKVPVKLNIKTKINIRIVSILFIYSFNAYNSEANVFVSKCTFLNSD